MFLNHGEIKWESPTLAPPLRVARSRRTKITMNSVSAPNSCHCPPHIGRLSQGSCLLQQQPLAPTQQQAILHGGVSNPLPSPLLCPSCVPLELPNSPSTVISDVHDLTLIQLPPPPYRRAGGSPHQVPFGVKMLWISQYRWGVGRGVWVEIECVVPCIQNSKPGRTMFHWSRSEQQLSLWEKRTKKRNQGAF